MTVEFKSFSGQVVKDMDEQMIALIDELDCPRVLKHSMQYSLKAGGKRIRPLLLFATLEAFNEDWRNGIPVACALEMIHTYSLIHDDLPAMDNDDLRRGVPTNHKMYGDAQAILAGDGLLTFAFQVMTKIDVDDSIKVKLINELALAAGPEGMVGGQVADIEGEGKQLSIDGLEYIHRNKTGKLLSFGPVAAAIMSEASEAKIDKIRDFSMKVGLAFQIQDDILDIEGAESVIGKPIGSDVDNDKTTYVSLYSLEQAKEILNDTIESARSLIKSMPIRSDLLLEICDLIVNREK